MSSGEKGEGRAVTLVELVLIVSLVALGPLSTDLYLPALPAIASDLHVGADSAQLTLSVFLLGFACGQLVVGPLSDRLGRRPVLLTGLVLYLAATLGCGLARTIGELQVARVLSALGACAGPVLGRAIVRDLFGPDRIARMLSYIGAAMSVAPMAGPPLGGALSAQFGWRGCFWFLGGISVLQLAGVLWLLKETNRRPDPDAINPCRILRNFGEFLRAPSFRGHVLCVAAAYGILFAYISGSSFVLQERYGLGPVAYGAAFGATVFGYFLAGLFSARQGSWRPQQLMRRGAALSLGATLAALGALAAGWLGPLLLVGLMFLAFAGVGLTFPNALAGALAPYPERAGAASSLVGFSQMTAASIVGALVGMAYMHLPGALPMIVAMAACAALGLWGGRMVKFANGKSI